MHFVLKLTSTGRYFCSLLHPFGEQKPRVTCCIHTTVLACRKEVYRRCFTWLVHFTFWFFWKLHYLIFQLLLLSCSLSLALFSLEDNTVYSLSYIEALVDNACFLCLYVGPRGSPLFTCWSWNSLVWYVFLTCSFSFDQLLLFTRLVMFERRLLFVGVVPNVLLLALSPTISHANLKPELS